MKIIGLIGTTGSEESFGMLAALASSCGLELCRISPEERETAAGCIVLSLPSDSPDKYPLGNQATIRVVLSDAAVPSSEVRFGSGPCCPRPYRGRTVTTDCAVPGTSRDTAGEVIATAGGSPVWITDLKDGVRHDTCWVSNPWIEKGGCVFDHLNGRRFMSLLPVLEWMRRVSDWHSWQQPPLQACFMFDDPNFHATSYGYVNFAQLAAEGRRHRYHSSFATVPLDSYYVNSTVARIVRENGATLSFLVHGNNHTYRELADRAAPPARQLAQMQQAMSRIDRLEHKAGVPVSRVMAPPHGICSAEMMGAMLQAGFEAVCVSHGSVWTGNPGAAWAVSLGALPSMVISGLPVIPRFGLDGRMENQVLLAAYLNQPIIPVGHHWDLATGLNILSTAARFINGLGEVRWGDMAAISRSHYRFKIEKTVMKIQPFTRHLRLTVPDGITELDLHAPWLDSQHDRMEIRTSSGSTLRPSLTIGPLQVAPGTIVELAIARQSQSAATRLPPPSTPIRVIGRKVLVELRDRTMPFLPVISRRR